MLGWVLSACGGQSKPPEPASDGRVDPISGAAVVHAFGRSHVVERAAGYCASLAPELAEPMRLASAAWQRRNGSLVRAAGKMQAHTRTQRLAQGEPGRKRWAEDERVMALMARGIDTMFAKPVGSVDAAQIQQCRNLIGQIDQGVYDIGKGDSDVLNALRKFQD